MERISRDLAELLRELNGVIEAQRRGSRRIDRSFIALSAVGLLLLLSTFFTLRSQTQNQERFDSITMGIQEEMVDNTALCEALVAILKKQGIEIPEEVDH